MARKPFFVGDFQPRRRIYPVVDDSVLLFAYELIVPAAITPITDEDEIEGLNVFPAKIDPGFTGNFHISQTHLESSSWADQSLANFQPTGQEMEYCFPNEVSEPLTLYHADLWLIGNYGRADKQPHHFRLDGGVTIVEQDPDAERIVPRIPLIGQRAFAEAEIRLEINYANLTFSLWLP